MIRLYKISLAIFLMVILPLIAFTQDSKNKFIYDCGSIFCIEKLNLDSSLILNYTDDNVIYKDQKEFVYSYKYIEDGQEYLIGNKGHILNTTEEIDDHTVMEVSFIPSKKEEEMWKRFDSTNQQTAIRYHYYNRNSKSFEPWEASGLVENEKNIWIHPFRRPGYFAMLNLNPYPFVKFPIQIADTYKWELKVGGDVYLNNLWIDFKGTTLRKHHYMVVSKTMKHFPYTGDIETYHIKANSNSEIGESSAEFYFSEEYGFVEMIFYNVNNSIFHFKLKEIRQVD